jgi:hypothetical protein
MKPSIFLEGLRETPRNLIQDSWYPSQYSNSRPLTHEAEILNILRLLVFKVLFLFVIHLAYSRNNVVLYVTLRNIDFLLGVKLDDFSLF